MTAIRRPGAASAAVLFTLCAGAVGAHLLAPEWSRRVGLDVWNYAAAESDRRDALDGRAAADARAEQDARRRAVADQLAARLVTRDATLATVADELRELFRDTPGSQSTLACFYTSVRDPRLLYARHAIDRVARQFPDADGVARDAVVARLETEYRELEAAQARTSAE